MPKNKNNFLIYTIVFVNGFSSLVLEILGSRILAPFYGSTIYVWSSLISVALGFLALGYYLGGKYSSKLNELKYLKILVVVIGFLITGVYLFKKPILIFSDNFGMTFGPLVSSILLFFLQFTFIGMITPLSISILAIKKQDAGGVSGKIFAFATVGSLVGALICGFYLIPNFSIFQIITGVSLLLIVTGLVFDPFLFKKNGKIFFILAIFILTGIVIRLYHLPTVHHFLHQYELMAESRTIGGDYRLVGIPRVSDGSYCLLIDATNQGCIDPRNFLYGTNYAVIADIIDTFPPNSEILILGGGVGEFIKYRARDDINYDIVDINPAIQSFFRMAGVNYDLGRVKFITSDARTYLRKTNKKYDVIFNDLIGNLDPVANASTKEFFELSREKTNSGGVIIANAFGKTDGSDPYVDTLINTVEGVYGKVYLLDDPNDLITYQVFAAGLSQKRLNQAKLITEERSKKEKVGNIKYYNYKPRTGQILTDEKNNLDTLWIKAISSEMSLWDFRDRFKRISEKDYM